MGIPTVPIPITVGVMGTRTTATQATDTGTELIMVAGRITGGRVRGITAPIGLITGDSVTNSNGGPIVDRHQALLWRVDALWRLECLMDV